MLLNGSADFDSRDSLAVFANDRINYSEPHSEGEVMGDCNLKPPSRKADGEYESFCELVYAGVEDLPANSELFLSYGNEYWQIKKHWNMLSKEHQSHLIHHCSFDIKKITK